MTKTFIINKGQKPSKEQIREVMEAKKYPIEPDEDAPELSPAMYKAFKSSVIQRNRKKMLDKKIIIIKIAVRVLNCYFQR